MPTKRNKAGNQQPYVPQGNGDASGEYADNQSGSNKHFTNFAKPDETEVIKEETIEKKQISNFKKPTDEETKPIEKVNHRESATNRLIGKCVNQRTEENDNTFKKVIDDSNDESVEILNKYLGDNDKLKIKFGSAGRNAAGRAWGYGDIDTNHNVHTIRHELGHTFDNWYGKDMEKDPNHFSFENSDYASVRFVDDETGKTMNEAIHEELGVSMYKTTLKGWKLSYIKQGRDNRETKIASAKRITDIFEKYGDKIYDEMTGIPNSRARFKELRQKYNDIQWNLTKDLENTPESKLYNSLRQEKYKAEEEYAQEMYRKGATSIIYSQSPKVQLARERLEVAREKYEQLKKKTFNEKFGEQDMKDYENLYKNEMLVYKKLEGVAGIVGDTIDYIGAGSTFYTTNGHGKNYFDQRKESGYVLEIFANMFDSYMSKDTWKRECVKEMFPQTSKIFEKIYFRKGKK